MLRFFVSVLEVIGLFIAFSVVQLYSLKAVVWLSMAMTLIGIYVLLTGKHAPRIRSRGKALAIVCVAGLCLLASSTKFQQEQEARLADLKTSDPVAYLQELKRVDLQRWLKEMRPIDPDAYLAELKKVDEGKWFNELLELKPDQFLQEAEARRKRACSDGTRLYEAYSVMKEHVLRQLKAPATADFPWKFSNGTRHIGDCVYVVIGYVDAQNSFGALLRVKFTGRFEYLPDRGSWRTLNVSVEG